MRISRYLRAQLMVNASFGLAIGIGLYFIGIPNAVFWGLLGMVLRFLPYIGAWMAAALPLALSIAIFQSWTQPVLTIGLFVAVRVGRPTSSSRGSTARPRRFPRWPSSSRHSFGRGSGAVSAWCWRRHLTVCLAVAGKYLPDLAFLDMLIGDKPSIAPGDRLYQRLLALNEEEVSDIVERYTHEHNALAAFDEAVLPALRSIEADFRAGVLSDAARTMPARFCARSLPTSPSPRVARRRHTCAVLCIPASHEGDELAALMLAQVLAESGIAATVFSSKLLAAESVEQAVTLAPAIVCISSLPPVSTIAARALCKRLRGRLPSARIVVGLWQPVDDEFTARRERLGKAGPTKPIPISAAPPPASLSSPPARHHAGDCTPRRGHLHDQAHLPTANVEYHPIVREVHAIHAGKPALSRSS
jgi:hypothetical protein